MRVSVVFERQRMHAGGTVYSRATLSGISKKGIVE
jgi:hypothetical protein